MGKRSPLPATTMSSPASALSVDFDALVREQQASLRAYIRALGAQDAWVDDLAQEVFLVAYREWERFDANADVGRWLRGIARNLVLNERRKSARRSRLLESALVEVLMEDEPLAGRPCAAVLEALRDCVSQLPQRSRQLLERRYTDDEEAVKLAEVFNASAAAVRQTLVRSRSAVRRCLAAKLGEAWE